MSTDSSSSITDPVSLVTIQLRGTFPDMAVPNPTRSDGAAGRYRELVSIQVGLSGNRSHGASPTQSNTVTAGEPTLGFQPPSDRSSGNGIVNAGVHYCISTQDYDAWSNNTGGEGFNTNANKRDSTIQLNRWAYETSRTRMTLAEILEKIKWEKLECGVQTTREDGGHWELE
jgi:hypothetical protein